jgi:type 1 glutamine amidotransferase
LTGGANVFDSADQCDAQLATSWGERLLNFNAEGTLAMNSRVCRIAFVFAAAIASASAANAQEDPWVIYTGSDGPGKGKHIVLVSGDEEYRSEEALPQLGKILAKHHGFKCTVLFAIANADITKKDKNGKVELISKAGEINPNVSNIPGLEALKTADLMIIATRYRNLPDEQMQHLADYIEAGKPIIGMRTATHAFLGLKGKFAKYNDGSNDKDFKGGFGRQVLGERWVSHHGNHGSQSTRGILNRDEAKHPILIGLKDGDIWGPTDVYGANPLAPSTILVHGQVLAGMKATDEPLKGKKNDPMMPIAWTREYKGGRIFTTTMGASQDLEAAGTRRMLVNASLWCVGLDKAIMPTLNVAIVGEYQPTPFGNDRFKKGVRPNQLSLK